MVKLPWRGRASSSGADNPENPEEYEQLQKHASNSKSQVKGFHLVSTDSQILALGLWFVVLGLILFGIRSPLSCVEHSEHTAKAPGRCNKLVGDTDLADTLHLPDFCWRPCEGAFLIVVCFSAGVGVIVQAVVIAFNHEGCDTCMVMRWYLEMGDIFGYESEPDAQNKYVLSKIVHPIKTLKEMGLRNLAKNDDKTLVPQVLLSKISFISVGNAIMQLVFTVLVSVSWTEVFFECDGERDGEKERVWSTSSTDNYQLGALGAAWLLLIIILFLVKKGSWSVQVKVSVKDRLHLLEQFTTDSPDFKGSKRYFPKEDPAEGFEGLKRVFLMELDKIGQDGLLVAPGELGELAKGEVVLHFKKVKPAPSPAMLHRKLAMGSFFMGALLLLFSSQACWVCVKGIRAPAGTTALDLDKRLMLLGACGRHRGIGDPCVLGGGALLLACAMQWVIVRNLRVQEKGGRSAQLAGGLPEDEVDQQLGLCVMDMRKTMDLDVGKYTATGTKLPTIRCHYWVHRDAKGHEEVMDCSPGGPSDSARPKPDTWMRSTRPRQVQLDEQPHDESELAAMTAGLHRKEYNPPSQFILIKEGSREARQAVPPEFVAGLFHAWVGLGPRASWELLSMGLGVSASLLVVFDVSVFLLTRRGSILSNCDEVHTGTCAYFDIRAKDMTEGGQPPIEFRKSIGMFVAIAGGLCAYLGTVALNVAADARSETNESLGACRTCGLYLKGMISGPFRISSSVFRISCSTCAHATSKFCRRIFMKNTIRRSGGQVMEHRAE